MKRTDKDVMILLHKPVKTVVGKKKKKKQKTAQSLVPALRNG